MRSLRDRISRLVAIVVIMLCGSLIYSNIYAIHVVRNNAYEANTDIMTISLDHADTSMKVMENYWAGIQSSSDLYQLMGEEMDIYYFTAKARLKADMENIVQTYEYVDGIFVYIEDKQDIFTAAKYSVKESECTSLRKRIQELLSAQTEEEDGNWTWMKNDGKYYLLRVFKVMDIYMGGWVSAAHMADTLKSSGMNQAEYITFVDGSGKERGNVLNDVKGLDTSKDMQTQKTVRKDGKKYLMVSCQSKRGDYFLVELIRDNSIIEGLGKLQNLLIILVLAMLIFLYVFQMTCNTWILKPVEIICNGLKSLRDGNLDTRLPEEEPCAEFRMVNQTFNDMAVNIKKLKIGVYEEKMLRQQSELQYMKLQVNPHFYINCLNIIHNLSIMKKNDLICEMTGYLGNHLRYTMEGNTLDRLSKEIAYVKNYIHIQELRFGKSLKVFMEIEPGTEDVMVPPLVIQTFLENTVKYQVVAGTLTEVYVIVCWAECPEDHRIRIEIWDNGKGFPQNILDNLQDGKRVIDERGEHYGIRNVCTRLHLIYGGKEKIQLANHEETGGAWIVLELPDNV